MGSPVSERVDRALRDTTPEHAIYELAKQLRDEGLSQVQLYYLFHDRLQLTPEGKPVHDVLADVLDCVWSGGWGKGRDLFPDALTDDQIKNRG